MLTLLKTFMVDVYSLRRLVVQLGAERSIEPFSGNETSSLQCQCDPLEQRRLHAHNIYPSSIQGAHAGIVVETRID
jgi:hypothetical protein